MFSQAIFLTAFSSLFLLSNGAPLERRADTLTCSDFKALGSSATSYKVQFYDNNPNDAPTSGAGDHSPYLPATTTDTENWQLATDSGASFTIKNCTSSSLKHSESGSCGHSGCYKRYNDHVQVLRSDEKCLSQLDEGSDKSYFGWKDCSQESGTSQLFEITQTANYALQDPNTVSYYSNITFNLIRPDGASTFPVFYLDQDGKTLEVLQDTYSQKGLSANLIAA